MVLDTEKLVITGNFVSRSQKPDSWNLLNRKLVDSCNLLELSNYQVKTWLLKLLKLSKSQIPHSWKLLKLSRYQTPDSWKLLKWSRCLTQYRWKLLKPLGTRHHKLETTETEKVPDTLELETSRKFVPVTLFFLVLKVLTLCAAENGFIWSLSASLTSASMYVSLLEWLTHPTGRRCMRWREIWSKVGCFVKPCLWWLEGRIKYYGEQDDKYSLT